MYRNNLSLSSIEDLFDRRQRIDRFAVGQPGRTDFGAQFRGFDARVSEALLGRSIRVGVGVSNIAPQVSNSNQCEDRRASPVWSNAGEMTRHESRVVSSNRGRTQGISLASKQAGKPFDRWSASLWLRCISARRAHWHHHSNGCLGSASWATVSDQVDCCPTLSNKHPLACGDQRF